VTDQISFTSAAAGAAGATAERGGHGEQLTVREVRRLGDLAALEPGWERLLDACPHATVFATPQWLLSWLEVFGDADLRAMTVWRGRQLVGLAPFRLDHRPGAGAVLGFVAPGVSDYHGVLAEPGSAGHETRAALLDQLAAAMRAGEIAACDLDQLPADEPLADVETPGLTRAVESRAVCPYVLLPATRAALAAQLPRRLGARVERCLRRLRRVGAAEITRADAGSVDLAMDAFFKLHAAAPELRRFHMLVARRMLVAGRLRLHVLWFDGSPAAIVYALRHRQRVFSYLGGADPRLASYSPGLIILHEAMASALEEGAREIDLLRGDEPCKQTFGARERRNRRLILEPLH
jgi:CelD/BcsL family acetyltransferase involved in cellulose biosynthesis